MLDRSGFELVGNAREHRLALVALVAEHADLDQPVRSERDIDLMEHRHGETVVADHDDRGEVVRLGTEGSALFGGEFQFHPCSIVNWHARGWFTHLEKKKHKFNKAWMQEHVTDHWVQEAKRLGYRARAAFKLTEIDERDRLIRPGQTIVDLGSAPGSWSQVAMAKLNGKGIIVALDLLPMEPIHGVEFIQGDFTDDVVLQALEQKLAGQQADLVLSDMAPNMSGVATVDQSRIMLLAELSLEFSDKWLKPEGALLVKVFQGEGFDEFRRQMVARFASVGVRKPKASRERSNELFLLGRGQKQAKKQH